MDKRAAAPRLLRLLRDTSVADARELVRALELNLPTMLLPETVRTRRYPHPNQLSLTDDLWREGPLEIDREPLVARISSLVRRTGEEDAEGLVRFVETELPATVLGDLLPVLVRDGSRINAIVLHRHRTGCGLAEAKSFICGDYSELVQLALSRKKLESTLRSRAAMLSR